MERETIVGQQGIAVGDEGGGQGGLAAAAGSQERDGVAADQDGSRVENQE